MNIQEVKFDPVLAEMLSQTNGTGASSEGTLRRIHCIIAEKRPKRTIEIGLAHGYSCLLICQSLREYCDNGTHIAIDPWQESAFANAGLKNIKRAGFDGLVRFLKLSSYIALTDLEKGGDRFDFAFIDGNHLFEDVFVDFFLINKIMSEGAVIVFDDCKMPSVRKVTRFIESNYQALYRPVSLASYCATMASRWRLHLAEKLGRSQNRAFVKTTTATSREWNSAFTDF